MQNLITNEQVISLAFGDGEYVSPNVVHDSDIAAATYRYIIPIVGEKLYEEMVEGSHRTLLSDYVAPALAMAVRTMIQPALNVRTGQGGLGNSLFGPRRHLYARCYQCASQVVATASTDALAPFVRLSP